MVSFTQITALATAFTGMTSALIAKPAVDSRALGSGCCTAYEGGCDTVTGATEAGQRWAYCWVPGTIKFGTSEGALTACLAGLHNIKDYSCFNGEDTTCATTDSVLQVSHASAPGDDKLLSDDDAKAIIAAADAAKRNGFSFNLDDGHSVNFVHTDDNGSRINGIEMYGSDFIC